MPKATFFAHLVTPQVYASPLCVIHHRLYSLLLGDELKDFSYDASVAGLAYSVTSRTTGLVLKVCHIPFKTTSQKRTFSRTLLVYREQTINHRWWLIFLFHFLSCVPCPQVSGYSHKLPVLLDRVVKRTRSLLDEIAAKHDDPEVRPRTTGSLTSSLALLPPI